eukprot:408102-Prorocentrum_minimum.AAC.1
MTDWLTDGPTGCVRRSHRLAHGEPRRQPDVSGRALPGGVRVLRHGGHGGAVQQVLRGPPRETAADAVVLRASRCGRVPQRAGETLKP